MTQSGTPQDFRQPYHFCTYFDRNYLTRGLALYHSLRRHCRRPFVLWTLCFDDETFAVLSRLNLVGIRLVRRADFEADDADLAAARANRTAVEYYWTCTPSLPLYVLRQDESIEVITYLDADLFFFSDPQPIFDEFGDGSILIHGHRYAPEHAHFAETSGIFNVGLLVFRRDNFGLECLWWWRERCNEWCYARFEDSKYGDQKYLDDWPERFRGVIVLQHPGAGLAPWNISQYQIESAENHILVNGYSLIFFHFHALKVVSPYVVAPSGAGYKVDYSRVAGIFITYATALRKAAYECGFNYAKEISESSTIKIISGLLNQKTLFTRNLALSKLIWKTSGKRCSAKSEIYIASHFVREGEKSKAKNIINHAFFTFPLIVFERVFISVAMRYVFGNLFVERLKYLTGRY